MTHTQKRTSRKHHISAQKKRTGNAKKPFSFVVHNLEYPDEELLKHICATTEETPMRNTKITFPLRLNITRHIGHMRGMEDQWGDYEGKHQRDIYLIHTKEGIIEIHHLHGKFPGHPDEPDIAYTRMSVPTNRWDIIYTDVLNNNPRWVTNYWLAGEKKETEAIARIDDWIDEFGDLDNHPF